VSAAALIFRPMISSNVVLRIDSVISKVSSQMSSRHVELGCNSYLQAKNIESVSGTKLKSVFRTRFISCLFVLPRKKYTIYRALRDGVVEQMPHTKMGINIDI
jgi:hypothetical protein